MSDHQLIGPGTPCTYCGEGYGMHYDSCTRPKPKADDKLRKRAEEVLLKHQNGITISGSTVNAMLAFAKQYAAEVAAEQRSKDEQICRGIYSPGDWSDGVMVAEKCAEAIERQK